MLNSIGQMGITEDVIFLNMHNSGSNFCGIKEILVADTIPVLLGIYYALDKEKKMCIRDRYVTVWYIHSYEPKEVKAGADKLSDSGFCFI